MMENKGQASIEFLVLLSVALLMLTATITISIGNMNSINTQRERDDANNAVMDLSSAAKEVYAQGEGARKQIYILIPGNYDPAKSFIGNQAIRMNVRGNDYVTVENFNVRGSLPRTAGVHWVWVISEGNQVRIGDVMLGFDKSRIYVVMNSNSTVPVSFTVTNIWDQKINVSTTTTWTAPDISLGGVPPAFSLNVNNNQPITLQFTSDSVSPGFYSGEIDFSASDAAGNSETAGMPIIVEVLPSGQLPYPSWDIQGPFVTSIYQVPAPALESQPLAVFANVSDVLTGNTSISGCKIDIDNQYNWNDMLPVDSAFDTPTETAMFNYTNGFTPGPHVVSVTCTDAKGNIGPASYYYLF